MSGFWICSLSLVGCGFLVQLEAILYDFVYPCIPYFDYWVESYFLIKPQNVGIFSYNSGRFLFLNLIIIF